MQDTLTTLATALEVAIVLFPILHAAAKAMPRRKSQPVPGQLAFDFTTPMPAEPEQQQATEVIAPVAVELDPWEAEVEPAVLGSAIAPLHPATPYLLLLPPAKEQAAAKPDYSGMNRDQLRKACQQQGIKWRDAKGKNKHLTVEQMRSALAAA